MTAPQELSTLALNQQPVYYNDPNMAWEQRLALDVRYVDEHDLRMDIDIIGKTVRIVLAREGIQHSDEESMPVLAASMPISLATESNCFSMNSTGIS